MCVKKMGINLYVLEFIEDWLSIKDAYGSQILDIMIKLLLSLKIALCLLKTGCETGFSDGLTVLRKHGGREPSFLWQVSKMWNQYFVVLIIAGRPKFLKMM